jgi:hypothetical protein
MQTRIELTFDVVSAASWPLPRPDTADLEVTSGDDRDATLDVGETLVEQ